MKSFLRRYWPVFFILFVELILFVCNYKKGTFLIGWDNLYPELNFSVNIKRSFFSVWQEYRSLGYIDSMSHAANLFHDFFRFFLSLFLPLNLIRWFFIFLMHLIGGVGVYFLMENYVLRKFSASFLTKVVALVCSLFYQYNLITIQMFFLPFELFLVHFAFLPWLIHFALEYLDSGRKKDFAFFAVFSFFSLSQAHVPTVFIVYVMALFLLFLIKFLLSPKLFKKIVLLILITFFLNCFWGFPFAYATLKNANVVAMSKNNQMATQDIFYRNQKFGNFTDVLTLKGIVLDYWQNDFKTNLSHYMMDPWLKHLKTWQFKFSSWVFIFLLFLGIAHVLLKKKKSLYPFLSLLFFSFVMMATDTPIFSAFSAFFRENLPLFGDVFRFVFTKFSFLYVFVYTIFFGLGLLFLIDFFKKKWISFFFCLFVLILLFSYTLPSFKRHFFYENLAVAMPNAYFETFKFFSQQDKNSRIALLPISNYWAWTQNNWNTIGSGFFWYGVPQPTTDRAFDPWNDKNENFYWELDQAIYSENNQLLEGVLEKYNISWLVVDSSVNTQISVPRFDISRYRQIFSQSGRIKLVSSFDFIDVYTFSLINKSDKFVSIKKDLPVIKPSYQYDNFDQAYFSYGNYQNLDNSKQETIFYPFRSLFSEKNPGNHEFKIEYLEDEISFVSKLDSSLSKKTLLTPSVLTQEFLMVNPISLVDQTVYQGKISLNGITLLGSDDLFNLYDQEINLPEFSEGILRITLKRPQITFYQSDKDANFLNKANDGCYKNPEGLSKLEIDSSLRLISKNSDNCINFDLPYLLQRNGYLVHLTTQNSPIRGLYFNLINTTTKKTDLDSYLENDGKKGEYSFIISPRGFYGLGYSLNLDNISFGEEKVINSLNYLEAMQIPYYFLKGITISDGNEIYRQEISLGSQEVDVKKNNFYSYSVRVKRESLSNNAILYLSQGYDKDWLAWEDKMFFGKKLPHLMVNNWANGWDISGLQDDKMTVNSQTIYLFYWPQLLEYLGFGLMLGGVIFIWRRKE